MRAAIYARFSTDKQRDASIDDQYRECERVAKSTGLTVVARFEDRGISGGTTSRPGYQALLKAARDRKYDIIVCEDISRLWRNRAEFGSRSAELEDLGVHCLTCVGDDTRRDGWGLVIQIKQAVAEHARREASYRTRRGLEGKALAGQSTGGRAFGYIAARDSSTGLIEIQPEHAKVVRRIFQMYADGHSPRSIAATLNAEGVPSPGSTWNRTSRRSDGKWLASAVNGDIKRGTGMLNNVRYIGVVRWGRSEWKRSAADSMKRRHRMLAAGSAHDVIDERLRIVPQLLWDCVKARQASQAHRIGERVQSGMSKAKALRTGAGPKYLLSSILRCGHCGSAYAIAGRDIYKCAGHTNGGKNACANDAVLKRHTAEREVLAGIKRKMRSPEAIREICARVRTALKKPKPTAPDHGARIAQLKAEIHNIADAIAGGVLRPSPTLANRLSDAELELGRLEEAKAAAAAPVPDVSLLLANLPTLARRAVDQLEKTLSGGDITRAREEIRAQVGTVKVDADQREIRLYSEQGQMAAALLRAVGSDASLYGSGGRI